MIKKVTYLSLLSFVLIIGCSKDTAVAANPEIKNIDGNDSENENANVNDSDNNVSTTLDLPDGFKAVLVQSIIIAGNDGVDSFYDIDIEKINNAYSGSKVQFAPLLT